MYIRRKKNKSGFSVQIVSSKRVVDKDTGKRSRVLKIIEHIGTATDENNITIKYLLSIAKDRLKVLKYKELTKGKSPLFDTLADKEESELKKFFDRFDNPSIYKVGFEEVIGYTFDNIFQDVYPEVCDKAQINVEKLSLLKDLVVAKIANPTSKSKTAEWINSNYIKYSSLERGLGVDTVYRLMDKIDSDVAKIFNNKIPNFVKEEMGLKINVLFFDATTIHFETFKEDNFRRNGYSKVAKHNQPQLLVGLIVNEQGIPLLYRVYEGNTYDGNTIKEAIGDVTSNFQIEKEKVVIVADSAMLSKSNLELIKSCGYTFILSHRKKSTSKELKEEILNKDNYDESGIFEKILVGQKMQEHAKDSPQEHTGIANTKVRDLNHLRLILSHKEQRARKDKMDRDKKISKLIEKLKSDKVTKTKLGNSKLSSKFIKIEGDATIQINEEQVKEDERWDGLKSYITNIPKEDMDTSSVIQRYKELWQAEKAFRIYKNDIRVRPVYHYKQSRIEAHLLISFLALFLSRYLEYTFTEEKYSIRRIVENLESSQVIILKDKQTGISIPIRSDKSEICSKIYQKIVDK